jgi:MbtH protein
MLMHVVVRNAEGQHSTWPADVETPRGWTRQGEARSLAACLVWIEEHWDDLRPLSLRGGA